MNLQTLQQKLFQGSLASYARIAFAAPVYLILTPLVLRTLGPELFGIWSFSTIIVSLMNLTDFGLKNSLIYHVAKHADGTSEVRRYFSMTMWMYVAFASLALLATALWGEEAMCALLNVPDRYRGEAVFVLWVTVAGFVWRLLATPYQAVVEGYQELASSQMISLSWLLVYFVCNLGALAISPTIYGLCLAGLAGNVFTFLAYFFTVRRRFPQITFGTEGIDGMRLRRMFGFGFGIQVAAICIALREPLYKVLIARSFDLTAVAAFDVTFKLCTQLMSVITTPLLGVFGAAALLAARRDDLTIVLRPLVGLTLGLLLPSALAVVSFARSLLEIWLGSEELAAGALLPVMCVAFAVYYSTEALYRTIEGTGLSLYSAMIQAAVLTLQLVSFWLLPAHDVSAAAWSLMAGYALFSLSNLWMFRVRFSGRRMFSVLQWAALAAPSGLYGASLALIPADLRLVTFGVYLLLHLWLLVVTKIVDLRVLWGQLVNRRSAARPALSMAGGGAE